MFVTAVIWSITSNLDKLGVRASTPLLWTATITTFIALCSIIFWLAMPHRPLRLRDTRYAVLSGMANAVGNALLMYALTLLFVPYVIAIKRMSALFTVIVSSKRITASGSSVRSLCLWVRCLLRLLASERRQPSIRWLWSK